MTTLPDDAHGDMTVARLDGYSIAPAAPSRPRATLLLGISTSGPHIASGLEHIGFVRTNDPTDRHGQSTLLDDTTAWVVLHSPADAFAMFVDRDSGLRLVLTDLDLTALDEPARRAASLHGLDVHMQLSSFDGALAATVRAFV